MIECLLTPRVRTERITDDNLSGLKLNHGHMTQLQPIRTYFEELPISLPVYVTFKSNNCCSWEFCEKRELRRPFLLCTFELVELNK